MNRRAFAAAALLATQSILGASKSLAQSSGRRYRIAVLLQGTPGSSGPYFEATKAGLRDLGYVEKENMVVDLRYAEGKYERLPHLAAEIVRGQPDVIVSAGTPALLALKQATTSIPIVIALASGPDSTGLVASLARPGGNITGNAILNKEMAGKRIELLRQLLPDADQIAVFTNSANRAAVLMVEELRAAIKAARPRIAHFEVGSTTDIEALLSMASKQKVGGAVIEEDSMLRANFKSFAELALKHRIPTCGPFDFAEAGGVLGFGPDLLDLCRRSAKFVDKILKGQKPAQLPVEQATKFTLVVNQRTARALRVKIPPSIMERTDSVID